MPATSALLRSRSLRWAAPAVAVAVVLGIGPLVNAVTADAHGALPPRTTSQLLVDVQQAQVKGLSGTVVETTDLGLPALPDIGGRGGNEASFSSLVSGSHTMRVWYAGPDKLRLALLGQLGESDLVRQGPDLWAWSSKDNSVTHWQLPATTHHDALPSTGTAAMTPQQAAQAALDAIRPSTRVTTGPTTTVAGRSAYQLVLQPRDTRSLVGSVRIAIDGSTHIPVRVQAFATGASSPAFQVGFTSFTPQAPSDSVFSFEPPPGATVHQGSAFGSGQHATTPDAGAAPQVVGRGWTTRLVVEAPKAAEQLRTSALLGSLPTVSGTWGSGHLLRSPLFSAVLTDDGRLAVGAVPPQMLYAALARR